MQISRTRCPHKMTAFYTCRLTSNSLSFLACSCRNVNDGFTPMKTQLTALQNERETSHVTEPVLCIKPVVVLWIRLLWAVMLALPASPARAAVVVTGLYSFHVVPNGQNPVAPLVQCSDGYLYGTTEFSATNGYGYGTVFKISPRGAVTNLYTFAGPDGAYPQAGLVQGSDGYLYGTTSSGGPNSFIPDG